MRIADWGQITGALVVFGGVHSNAHALDALLALPGAKVCTGDIVAYCAEPAACVSRMREAGIATIAGNCESQLAADALDCGCGFGDGTACDLLSARWYAHANAGTDREGRDWMAALPDWALLTHAGRRWLVVHGTPSAQNRFVWSTTPDADLVAEIALAQARVGPIDGILSGHSGIPFLRQVGRHVWLNAGAIGMPAHDGSPRTHFARIAADGSITLDRLDYDAAGARAAMVAAGLDQGYHDTLLTGWWPSEDVLPDQLRRSQPSIA